MHQGPGLGVLSRWVVLQRRSQQLLQDECSVWLEQQLCCNGIAAWHLGAGVTLCCWQQRSSIHCWSCRATQVGCLCDPPFVGSMGDNDVHHSNHTAVVLYCYLY